MCYHCDTLKINLISRCREYKGITLREKSGTILVNMNTSRHRHITGRPVILIICYCGALNIDYNYTNV